MLKSDELILKVRKEYHILSLFNPDNELLKYYNLRGYKGRIAFWPNQDIIVKAEFFRRFGRGLPELLNDLEKHRINISTLEYGELVNSFLLQNYDEALEREVAPPEMRN